MKCKNCETELTKDEIRDCYRCLKCYPEAKKPIAPPKPESKYIDVAMTEAKVREICRDVLEDWHVPSVTKAETKEVVTETTKTWRQEAKEMGIPLFQRKKEDVLEDIETKKSQSGQ